ncbi:CopG family ribbon-helix-helix protein [Solimicrobium silvestre]|uniref:Ribbon-helix-helix protein, copG family n=1 Tax=Solimicrobium silvestre TaxID=2099400 RepID=A0A2S9GV62_9BURK|nr:CopG family transcriptional regulator [Solimicrobium silvestre]PRC91609.1 hypothetical protein S2091_3725 [Solimicrobium silvestre]
MTTTTIRLSDELKARITAAANHAETTTHNFILQAIAEKTAQEELKRDFDNEAEARYANILATGKAIPWHEMRDYLESRASGKTSAIRPTAKKLVR